MLFFDGDKYGRKFANTSAFTTLILSQKKTPIIIAHSIEKDHAESESRLEIIEIKNTMDLKSALKGLFSKRIRRPKIKIAIIPWNAKFEKVKLIQELDYEIIDA